MIRKTCVWATILVSIIFLGKGGYIHAKAILAQHLMQNAWHRTLKGDSQVKPWQWADTWPVARLTMKSKNIDQIILAGDTGNVLAFGPGHMPWSAKPGDKGTCVISGHRDTSFYFLKDVKTGDKLQLYTSDNKIHNYTIINIEVQPSDEIAIDFNTDESNLILITCYPFDSYINNNKRLVVSLNEYNL